jgi:hypothetical protein
MKRKIEKLRLTKETLIALESQNLRTLAGGLIPSENPEQPCDWTAGGTCGEWTCLGATCDYLCR